MKVSVLTLVRGRSRHLANVIRGLENNSRLPDELVIVHMNEDALPQQSAHFPIRVETIRDPAALLPLAAARNHAAMSASGDALVFLDVDCIPAPALLDRYHKALLAHPEALHQGEVRYLPEDAKIDFSAPLQADALPHPLHAEYVNGQRVPYPLFWSLSFACTRATFMRIGRFDERYRGYGAEDTDFAFRAREADIPLYRSDALAFHQYHPSYSPPLNHFDSIIDNARVFKNRWGHWPMEGWLQAFAQRGLVTMTDNVLVVLRSPTADEIADSLTFPTTPAPD